MESPDQSPADSPPSNPEYPAAVRSKTIPFGAKEFVPGALWPDDHGVHINAHGGGILLFDGTYYWYGEHKIEGGAGNRAYAGVHVYASRDLFNWRDEGIALAVSTEPGHALVKGCVIERPKVMYNARTGKFVMWFHHELEGQGYRSALAGVATADSPLGPFQYLRSERPNKGVVPLNMASDIAARFKELKTLEERQAWVDGHPEYKVWARDFDGGQMARDMNCFVDDDGKAYHFFSSEENHVMHISELSDDYLFHTGRYVRAIDTMREAPAPFKRNGIYYMFNSFCTGWDPNPTKAYRALDILGKWEELGECFAGDPDRAKVSYESQPTFVLQAPGHRNEFIFMADRWTPKNAIDGRYIWLPVEWLGEKPVLRWHDSWDSSIFENRS